LTKKNHGKIFEENFESSCKKAKVFFSRNRDIYIPPDLRKRIQVPKNPYDYFMFSKGILFPLELKSTKEKSFSFSESIIKQHQIDSLTEAQEFDDVISGFIFNFREPTNRAFFVHIHDFNTYKDVAENGKEHTYKSRVNGSSIPIGVCEEIGLEIKNKKLKTNYRYDIQSFVQEAIEKFGGVKS
jgi:penicillin-binding protein-related factor A (putative recombinase)